MHPLGKTVLDRKMNGTSFDGQDELYHNAKFRQHRTTRAGCRCDNVVFVTGRMPRSSKLPVLNLLTGQKSGFSPRRDDSLHRFNSNLAGPTGTWGLGRAKFRLNRQSRVGMRPKNIRNFHFFVKSRPVGATPLTDVENF